MDKNFHKEFSSCPNCGSTERFCESLGQELKDSHKARAEWNFRYDQRAGPVVDPNRQILMPVGAEVPGFLITTDICMQCGTVYAIELRRLQARIDVKGQKKNPFSTS